MKKIALLLSSLGMLNTAYAEDNPSIELLEYLSEYSEDTQGKLIDPMDQQQVQNVSYRDYIHEKAEQQ